MQAVITAKQAKQITGGRKTLTIIPYEAATTALRECLEFDDVKYWDNLADAYAAWGKINRSDEVIRLGKALKLKAAQRMGEIAIQIRPGRGRGRYKPGANSVLREQGMKAHEAQICTGLARMSKGIVDKAASSAKPPSPAALYVGTTKSDWTQFTRSAGWAHMRVEMQRTKPSDAALMAKGSQDISRVRDQAIAMNEWLDDFIARLPGSN